LSERRVTGEIGPLEVRPRERRSSQRVPVCIEVDYRADDTFLFAYITDISAMGIFIRTLSPETPGTRLTLRFVPPPVEGEALEPEPPIEVEGEVIWINPPRDGDDADDEDGAARNPGMGVQFVELGDDERERIFRLVRTFAYLSDDRSPGDC
jgi:type IV pilus assembly protein PilZ